MRFPTTAPILTAHNWMCWTVSVKECSDTKMACGSRPNQRRNWTKNMLLSVQSSQLYEIAITKQLHHPFLNHTWQGVVTGEGGPSGSRHRRYPSAQLATPL